MQATTIPAPPRSILKTSAQYEEDSAHQRQTTPPVRESTPTRAAVISVVCDFFMQAILLSIHAAAEHFICWIPRQPTCMKLGTRGLYQPLLDIPRQPTYMKLGTGGLYQPLLDIPRQPTCMKLSTGGFYQPLLDIPRQPTCMKKVACLYCLCRPIIPILYKSLQHCVRRVLFTLSTVWPTVPRIS